MKTSIIVTVCALALSASLAVAQGPGPGGQRQRGQGAGMGMGQGPLLAIGLLQRPDVQKELNLTDEQKQTLAEKLSGLRQQPGQRGERRERGDQRRGGGDQRADQQRIAGAIKEVLNDKQFERFQQLVLQRAGPSAIAGPDVAKQLSLTEKQQTEIRDIQRASGEKARAAMQEARGDREAMRGIREKMQASREAAGKQILGLLTAEQQKKWKSLLGKPFKFETGRA